MAHPCSLTPAQALELAEKREDIQVYMLSAAIPEYIAYLDRQGIDLVPFPNDLQEQGPDAVRSYFLSPRSLGRTN